MHAGKSTAADYLIEEFGYRRLSFAEPVKQKSLDMLNAGNFRAEPFTRAELDANKSVFRPLLQWVGTELGREYVGDENYWVNMLAHQIDESDAPIVIDDARFPSEWEFLRQQGFTFAYIDRDREERFRTFVERQGGDPDREHDRERFSAKWAEVLAHPSEPSFSLIERHTCDLRLINNNTDPEWLFVQIKWLVDLHGSQERNACAPITATSV